MSGDKDATATSTFKTQNTVSTRDNPGTSVEQKATGTLDEVKKKLADAERDVTGCNSLINYMLLTKCRFIQTLSFRLYRIYILKILYFIQKEEQIQELQAQLRSGQA